MSGWLTAVLWGVAAILVAVMIVTRFRVGRPITGWITSTLQGVCALAAVDLVGTFTGVSVGFGWLTVGTCAVLGIPGVITLLLLKCIFV